MNIVSRGAVVEKKYVGTCRKCNSVIEYNASETESVGTTQLESYVRSIRVCPVCQLDTIPVYKKTDGKQSQFE